MIKQMTTFFCILFILLMVFATGAIEADNFLIGTLCAFLGFVSGITAIYLQEKDNNKTYKLYYTQKE